MNVCEFCKKEFKRAGKKTVDDPKRFCSLQCYWDSMKQEKKFICKTCDKEFIPISHGKEYKYCSRNCMKNGEWMEKQRQKQLGVPAWNKGKPAPWARWDLLFQPDTRKKALENAIATNKMRVNELNPNYKGDKGGYTAVHAWVRRRGGSANHCSFDTSHKSNYYDWCNVSGSYLRDMGDWIQLCRKCHKQYDMIRGVQSKYSLVKKGKEYRYVL